MERFKLPDGERKQTSQTSQLNKSAAVSEEDGGKSQDHEQEERGNCQSQLDTLGRLSVVLLA